MLQVVGISVFPPSPRPELLGFTLQKQSAYFHYVVVLSAIPATTETMSDRGNNSQSNNAALLEELTEFCRSDSLSEDGLREIMERHGRAPNNDPSIDYEFFHRACRNERVTEGILRYLIEHFPNAVRAIGGIGQLPIHSLFRERDNMNNVTLGMVQLLIDAFPDSVRHENIHGCMPLHYLCRNGDLNEEIGLEILKLLVKRCPESVRHAAGDGVLPIHIAVADQSPEFCRTLIEAYPGSERMTIDNNHLGVLPFHLACTSNTVATAKYLYQLYPESINVASNNGVRPIHSTILGLKYRDYSPETAIEMVVFLLDCDPNVVSQKLYGKLPLYWVCIEATENTPKLNVYNKILRILYDAYPEAIEDNQVTSDVGSFCEIVQAVVRTHLAYARQARDRTVMTTRDQNGQLPLHRALSDNVTLGSTKLLVKGNLSAVRTPDSTGAMPLHLACQHQESASIVEYLIGLDQTTLQAVDEIGNTVLHYACRGAKYDTIALLLDNYGGISISQRNAHNQLPIHLLLESKEVSDRDDPKYMESIYRLLRAYPETVIGVKEESKLDDDSLHHSGKKKKFGMKASSPSNAAQSYSKFT